MSFYLSMYYLSFTPLWISVLIMDGKSLWYDKTNSPWVEGLSIICIVVFFAISCIVMLKSLNVSNAQNTEQVELKDVKEDKFLIAEFLMAYIFPLFAFDFTKWDGVVLFLIFFVIFGWQCIKHNYLCVNVVLDLMGYTVFDCKLDNSGTEIEKRILSKRKLRSKKNTDLTFVAINNDFVIDISKDSE